MTFKTLSFRLLLGAQVRKSTEFKVMRSSVLDAGGLAMSMTSDAVTTSW